MRRAFMIAGAMLLPLMLVSSRGYGINWDEPLQRYYGESILNFYKTFGRDTSHFADEHYIRLYQGFFEVIASLATRLSDADPFDTRHLIVALSGFIAMVFTGLVAKEITGWRGALIALILIFATPIFFGHAMFNSKDIPFAAGYIASVYFLVRLIKQLPTVRAATLVGLGLALAATLGTRLSGVILYPLVAAFAVVWAARLLWLATDDQRPIMRHQLMRSLAAIAGVCVASYALSLLFWPFGLVSPIRNTLLALRATSAFKLNDVNFLFEGQWIFSSQVPWYYVPKYFALTTPLFVPASIIAVVVALSRPWMPAESKPVAAMVLATAILPVAYVMFGSMNLYDSWRQFLFIYPPMVAVFASAWDVILSRASRAGALAVAGCLALLVAEPLAFMVRNHPFEHGYFSPLAGGPAGAFKRYEIDYYGLSLRSGVEWLVAHAQASDGPQPVRVRTGMTAVMLNQVEYFSRKYPDLQYVNAADESTEWDYSIVLATEAKYRHELVLSWPPAGTVHEVKVDDAPILAVVRNMRANQDPSTFLAQDRHESPDVYVAASVKLIERGDFALSVAASDKALALEPANAIAYNNRGVALANLGLFDEAVVAGARAQELEPGSERFRNNYANAVSQQRSAGRPRRADSYIALSLSHFTAGLYDASVAFSRKALEIEPKNARAYNNLCAAYNGLKRWADAARACETALQIDPGFELAKNNLAYARRAH